MCPLPFIISGATGTAKWHRLICSWEEKWCEGRYTGFTWFGECAALGSQSTAAPEPSTLAQKSHLFPRPRGPSPLTAETMFFQPPTFNNVTGVFANRTWPRPSWRDWQQCFQNRPTAVVCRLRLKNELILQPNSTGPSYLTARSAPYVPAPGLPSWSPRKHVYGRIRSCGMSSDTADYNATTGAPLQIECAYFPEPFFSGRSGGTVEYSYTLQYDDENLPAVSVTSGRIAMPAPTAGGTFKVGSELLSQPAHQFPKH